MKLTKPLWLGESYKLLTSMVFLICFLLSLSFYVMGVELYFTLVFDLLIFSSVLLFKTTRLFSVLIVLLLSYILYHIFYVYYYFSAAHLRDLFLSLKFTLYFLVLCSIFKREIITKEYFSFGFSALLAFFFVKYTVAHLMGDSRPPLYTENNFEMCFLSVLYLVYVYLGKSNSWKFILFSSVILLSGSRSAIICLLLLYLYQFRPFYKISITQLLKLLALFIIGALTLMVIMSRMTAGGLEEVDRYIFLMVFFDNISDWGVKEYLVGNSPLTPLSSSSCLQLSYYQSLFSKVSDGVCYPLILHLFWLRIFMEHGLVAIIVTFLLLVSILKQKGLDTRGSIFILALISVNGLSVSAFSSSIIFFSLIIIALMKPFSEIETQS
ncbi:hypothetical protein [Pseudoalteromonas sp. SR41-4]|uniref:hypothetical protein n=1 Tax=Pseudoalteromonas sp. SR41-4 TaxID=2760950 RepID=UPI001600E5BE|nr:hypothetical protein [Pseudoalteromonas sp. SR41-4]MBB1295362.1 hypothetical protein [Pseudoalteromonas sp. SR41-4]